ncbi:MAG: trehalose-phosphatase, partial [Candidatus Hydrothermae bacterium]|nr:trehalose-phosphatase [Candidatus Hydrothermae bacterium]
YQILKRQIEELVGKVNGRHGTIGWVPVWYLYRPLPFNKLVALYSAADVALVTPMRDGMNLISKEYIATKVDGKGVLILSERAGAASELGEAIIVNPDNKEETVKAIREALTMPEEEQIERNRIMQERLKRYNIIRWAQEFIDRLEHTKELQRELQVHRVTPQVRRRIMRDYSKATRRLLLLDYDGTLVPFVGKPSRAQPDPELRRLLSDLTADRRNEVVIISGRDRKTLENWFGSFDVNLVGEHGVWIKERGEDWRLIEPLKNDWKDEIRPILELFTDRTPGSFIEEKEYSLVWHYRRANPELAIIRSRELKETLLDLTRNRDIGVLEGNKVIEVKKVGISKGKAALNWLEKENWDFILAIGDDWTDEDVFEVLPGKAYSIKVGFGFSRAAYRIESPEKVRELLSQLGGESDE